MKAKTKSELLSLYYKKHSNYYDYSKFDLSNKIHNKVTIICPVHGDFLQNHLDHITSGCPKCSLHNQRIKRSKFLIKDLAHLDQITNYQFDFSKSVFVSTSSRLYVKCKKHNLIFYNTAYHIARGAGCSQCKKDKISIKKRLTIEEFINRANIKHNKKYDYSHVIYKNLLEPVSIICPKHGLFKQKPREHLSGSGCQECANSRVSKISQEWLNSLNLSKIIKEHIIITENRWYKADGYDPMTNTIYEFYGDYWHGNPAIFEKHDINPSAGLTFGELYQRTLDRENNLKNLGYNITTIWENDYVRNTKKNT